MADLHRLTATVQGALARNTSAKAAIEIALYDLYGQLHGAPLYKVLGGGVPRLTTDITISVDTIDKMVADALSAIERGFDCLKIKVGKDIDVDVERVKAIHAAVAGRAAAAARREPGLDARRTPCARCRRSRRPASSSTWSSSRSRPRTSTASST